MAGADENRFCEIGGIMSNQTESRRAFLKTAAAGAGAMVTGAVVPLAETRAAEPNQMSMPASEQHGAFFNGDEAAAVAAFAERIFPGAPGMPGAHDADVLNYIDLALAGAYSDLQEFYRHGLNQLDAHCSAVYRQPFARLDAKQQDEVVAALEANRVDEFTWPTPQAFFTTLRTHTIEGMFADPVYGGNKDFAGWRLIGFPGAQEFFNKNEIQSRDAFTRAPMTGLQMQAAVPKQRG
jgi:gluconate 2-dehydrogenase gamma chain